MEIKVNIETEMQAKAIYKIEECITKIKGLSLPPEILVKFSLNSVCTGGRCCWVGDELKGIEIHGKALEFYGDEYLSTVVYEFAHIVQYHNFPRCKPHDESWKYIMGLLGADPKRCHDYDLRSLVGKKKVRQRRWEYLCSCGVHPIATVTHNRMQKGQQRKCNKCKGTLTFTGKELK